MQEDVCKIYEAIPLDRHRYGRRQMMPDAIHMRIGTIYLTPDGLFVRKTKKRIVHRSSTLYDSAISPMRYTGQGQIGVPYMSSESGGCFGNAKQCG